jgi:hypothetical protein
MRLLVAGLAIGIVSAGSACAQYVISAHSGVIQYVEGHAYLNADPVEPKFGQFPDIKENQEFRTEEGRAEILLTPGVFLRLGENSSVRMLSSKLTDTRVEILNGSAIVECDDVPKDNSVWLVYKGTNMALVKHGLYRVDTNPARIRAYDGEAILQGDSGQLTLKGGKQTALDGVLMAEGFDKNDLDGLYRWSDRRAGYVAKANVSSAMSMQNSGYGSGYGSTYSGFGLFGSGYSGFGSMGGWQWNPFFGMFSWVPYQGIGYSPFGYSLWSPYTVSQVYYAPTGTVSRGLTSSGTSSGFRSVPASSSAPVMRSGGLSAGHSSAGGHR